MEKKSVCPWWMGYFLIIPLRKYWHNPVKILKNLVKPGMKVIDYGSAMGYFSLPMAKMVGDTGKVYCFDIQEKMLEKLNNRAKSSGLESTISPRLILNGNNAFNDLKQTVDFTLLFAVAHEVPDREQLFAYLSGMMKSKARLVFAEPIGHVKWEDFKQSVSYAEKAGFIRLQPMKINRSYGVLMEKS